jgi:glycerate kinase/predicted metal-binding membrane protein
MTTTASSADADHALWAVSAAIFVASAAATIAWCASMSAMPAMPMPGGWRMSMAWMRMPGQTWAGAGASFLGMWVVMMVAMMLPSLVPRLRGCARGGRAALAGAGYFLVWSALGLVVFPVGVALAGAAMRWPALARAAPLAFGLIIVTAGCLQLSRWKARQLACCRGGPGCGTLPARPGASWRYGVELGLRCVSCCAGPTAVLLVTGVMDLRAMAVVTAAITLERLAPAGQRAARAIGAVAIAVGLAVLASTAMNLVAPTAFKGTMTPLEAARHLAAPGDRLLPLSDGGDGFLECLHHGLGGSIEELPAADPFGRVRPVPVLRLPDGGVAIECARVIGLAGLDRLDPLAASSRGLGELLGQVAHEPRIWIGLGGSATVDGGRDWPALRLPPTTVFCDVRTDLADAVRIFGPQKGARPRDLPLLAQRLAGLGLPRGPHTGAAGGLGARLLSLGAELVDGGERMLDVLGFDAACRDVAAVVTGEGRLDASSLEGKLPVVVARRARALGRRVIGRFGSRGAGWEQAAAMFDEVGFLVDVSPGRA